MNCIDDQRQSEGVLIDRISAFALELAENWNGSCGKRTAKYFQLSYLNVNAFRAFRTAQSFWILHSEGRFHECHILARVLLERIIYGRIAMIGPKRACQLIAALREEEAEGIRKWGELDGLDFTTELAKIRKDRDRFLRMAKQDAVEKKSFFDLAKEVGTQSIYRSAYRDLSFYVHASFGVSRPNQGDDDEDVSRYIALFAPMDCAYWFNSARNGRGKTKKLPVAVSARYTAIHSEITAATICRHINDSKSK